MTPEERETLEHALRTANVACKAGKPDEAVALLASAVYAFPEEPELHGHLSLALLDARRFEAAIAAAKRAVELAPRSHQAWSVFAIALGRSGNPDSGIKAARRAAWLQPNGATYLALGEQLARVGDNVGAIRAFKKSEELSPALKRDNIGLGYALLRLGCWVEGWDRYEGRYNEAGRDKRFPRPQRTDLRGKRILLWAWGDSGLGDQIMLFRFLPKLASIAAHVTLDPHPALAWLAQGNLSPFCRVISAGTEAPPASDFDLAFPLQSLPYMLGEDAATLPPILPLRAPAEKWIERPAGRPRVAFVYRGSAGFPDDHLRSPGLDAFRPILDVPGVRFVSLQVEGKEPLPPHVDDLAPKLKDLANTAAVIAACDLVISSCTSVAHLAGSMGKPLWVMLPRYSYFAWGARSDDCDFYPSARLFRQEREGDWSAPANRMAAALREELA